MHLGKAFYLCGIAVLAVQSPAWAQQDATALPPVEARVPVDAVGDIIVTANRREERLQSVPTAITAVTGSALQQSGINNLRDLTQIAPGLTLTRASNAYQPFIRGVGTRNSSVGDEPNVSVYVDGVYQPEMAATAVDLVGIERIEVLRGPQGTLFGRNATGGLINVITADPSYETHGTIFASYGRFNEATGKLYVTTGLADNVAVNLSAFGTRTDGYLRDVVRNKRVGGRDGFLFRGKLLFEPSEGARVVLTLSYSHVTDPSNEYRNAYTGNTSGRTSPGAVIPTAPWRVTMTAEPDIGSKQFNASARTSFDLGGALLETTSGYQSTRSRNSQTDDDFTSADILRIPSRNHSDYFSQEVRLLSDGAGPLKWIVGGYAFIGKGKFDEIRLISRGVLTSRSEGSQKTRSFSAFGEGTLEFAPDWFLLAGARYTTDLRIFNGQSFNGAGVLTARVSDARKRSNAPTYRASLRRDFGNTNVYASYSRGFKSGTYNTGAVSTNVVRPEKLDAYEIGIKSNPLSILQTNLSLFHYDYRDIQLTGRDPVTSLTVLTNAARARINGAELEVVFAPTSALRLSGNIAYLDAKYKSFPAAQVFNPILDASGNRTRTGNVGSIQDVSGNRMFRAPEWTISLNADYTVETNVGDFGINGNFFRSARFYFDTNNRTYQPAYTRLNSEISFTPVDSNIRLALFGRNLTNAVVYGWITQTANGDGASYLEPRTYGISAQYKF